MLDSSIPEIAPSTILADRLANAPTEASRPELTVVSEHTDGDGHGLHVASN